MVEKRNNMELKPYEHYLAEYRRMPPGQITARLSIPYSDVENTFQIRFLSGVYRVSYPDFEIHYLCGSDGIPTLETDRYAQILLLRYFLEGNYQERSGLFVPFRDLPWGETYAKQFQGRCVDRLAHVYGNRQEIFAGLMEKLCGVRMHYGDISYDFELMEGFYIRFILWHGDEEFPPSAQILFSDNFMDSFFVEDVAYIGDIVLRHMAEYEKKRGRIIYADKGPQPDLYGNEESRAGTSAGAQHGEGGASVRRVLGTGRAGD